MLKMWYVWSMEYYSAIIKHEIRPFAETQIDLDFKLRAQSFRINLSSEDFFFKFSKLPLFNLVIYIYWHIYLYKVRHLFNEG